MDDCVILDAFAQPDILIFRLETRVGQPLLYVLQPVRGPKVVLFPAVLI